MADDNAAYYSALNAAQPPTMDTSGWNPDVLAYYQQLQDYRNRMSGLGYTVIDPRLQGGYYDTSGKFYNTAVVPDLGIAMPNMYTENQDYYKNLMGQYGSPEGALQSVMRLQAPVTGESGESYFGDILASPTTQYRLVDQSGGNKPVYTGTGYEALQKIREMVPGMSGDPAATWAVEQYDPTADAWTSAGAKKIDTSTPGWMKALGTALPIATAFIPGLNVLGAMATQAASGAIGAGMAGRDPLMGGLVGGLTAGALKAPILPGGQSISGALGKAISPGIGGNTAGLEANFDKVLGTTIPSSAGGALGSAAGSVASGGLTGGYDALNNIINVVAQKAPSAALTAAAPTAIAQLGYNLANATANAQPGTTNYLNQIDQQMPQDLRIADNVPAAAQNEIVVAARNGMNIADIVAKFGIPAGAVGAIISGAAGGGGTAATSSAASAAGQNPAMDAINQAANTSVATPATGGLTASQIAELTPALAAKSGLTFSNLLRAGSLINSLVSGGGGTSGAPGTGGTLAPIFSAKLPTVAANAPGTLAARPDWTRFGMGSQQPNLPAEVPQYGGVMPPGFDPETLKWLGPEPVKKAWGGYAQGGVDGPGDGRSDSIPAQLSDGEYVIDAETVALLGNGSNKAGAKKLDQFRVNIRKSKGGNLAKGKFSVKAKRPESYLSGGK